MPPINVEPRDLADSYFDLLRLPDAALDFELEKEIEAELELPDADRPVRVLRRLQAWLELDSEDRRIIAAGFARALRSFSSAERLTIAEAERDVVMNGMHFSDFLGLVGLLAWSDPSELEMAPLTHRQVGAGALTERW